MTRKRHPLPTLMLIVAALAVGACQTAPPEPVETVAERVENQDLGLAIADLPAPFRVAENEGSILRLAAESETGGDVLITVGEPEYGLNLQAEVVRRGDAFRAMPGGEYNGSRELVTPTGPAYYSRGSYAVDGADGADGTREEQTWIFALHPSGDSRLLAMTYTYPAGEGQSRVNELLGLLGELEATHSEPAAEAEPTEPLDLRE